MSCLQRPQSLTSNVGTARAEAAQQMRSRNLLTCSGDPQTAWHLKQALVAVSSATRASFRWLESPSELCLPGEVGLAQAPGSEGGAAPAVPIRALRVNPQHQPGFNLCGVGCSHLVLLAVRRAGV